MCRISLNTQNNNNNNIPRLSLAQSKFDAKSVFQSRHVNKTEKKPGR